MAYPPAAAATVADKLMMSIDNGLQTIDETYVLT
jgi:hypothetical protein